MHHVTQEPTSAAVEGQATGGVEMLDEELRQDDLIRPQGVVPVLPVQHQVVLVVGVCMQRRRRKS